MINRKEYLDKKVLESNTTEILCSKLIADVKYEEIIHGHDKSIGNELLMLN